MKLTQMLKYFFFTHVKSQNKLNSKFSSVFFCLNISTCKKTKMQVCFFSGDQWNMTGITLFANMSYMSAFNPCKCFILVGSMVWAHSLSQFMYVTVRFYCKSFQKMVWINSMHNREKKWRNIKGEESSFCKINTFYRQIANPNDDDE